MNDSFRIRTPYEDDFETTPTAAEILYGGAAPDTPYLPDADKPLIDGVTAGLAKARETADPADLWELARQVGDIRRSRPELEDHLPMDAVGVHDDFWRAYDEEQAVSTPAGGRETPEDRARFRDAAAARTLAGLKSARTDAAGSSFGKSVENKSTTLPMSATLSTIAAWPGAEIAPGGGVILRPRPGMAAGGGSLDLGRIAGEAGKTLGRQVIKRATPLAPLVAFGEAYSPSPTARRRTVMLDDGLRFTGMSDEITGSLQKRDPETGEWTTLNADAAILTDAEGNPFVTVTELPNATPPNRPTPPLPDRTETIPDPVDTRIPGFPGEAIEKPAIETLPIHEEEPFVEGYPDDSEEFSEPYIAEQTHLIKDPIPMGKGNGLPQPTAEVVSRERDEKWQRVMEEFPLKEGLLDGYGKRVTNISRPEETFDDAQKDFEEIISVLGVPKEKIKCTDNNIWVYESPDGRNAVTLRTKSGDGRTTIEIHVDKLDKATDHAFKIRYGANPR